MLLTFWQRIIVPYVCVHSGVHKIFTQLGRRHYDRKLKYYKTEQHITSFDITKSGDHSKLQYFPSRGHILKSLNDSFIVKFVFFNIYHQAIVHQLITHFIT